MTNNLWEIIKFDDLVFLLRNAEKRFVVLSIVTEETDEKIRKMMKNFVKEKSKIYHKVTFLFYKAKKSDFGKLYPMFDKDITKYPKLIHIWDVRDIMLGVMAIDNKEIMEKSFEDFHNLYLVGTLPNNKEESHNKEESYNDNESIEEQKQNNNQIKQQPQNQQQNQPQPQKQQQKQQQQTKIPHEQQLQSTRNQIQQSPPIQQQPYKDPEIEKKKFVEKIQLLRKKQEDATIKFLTEFNKRKKEEEKANKKEKKNK